MSWNNYSLSSTKLDAIQNHDSFQIVWFGSVIYLSEELNNMTEFLHQYFEFEGCKNYIKSVKNDRSIFLVLTDCLDCKLDFEGHNRIHSIYILNKNQQKISDEIINSSKFTQIFNDENILIKRLRYDIVFTYRNDLPISFSSINDMKNEQSLIVIDESTLFYWNQLFFRHLVNDQNPDREKLKEEMIEQCRSECQNDKNSATELSKIVKFENTSTSDDDVLELYTADSCIYRLVNKAFRTRNIDLICKFRYFIILLCEKLRTLSNEQQGSNDTVLYRGQTLKDNEIKILQSNVGHLISFNTPLSTTKDLAVANVFGSYPQNAIIFEIHIMGERNNSLCPFADISKYSTKDEEETLFFPGATFRIDSIKKDNDNMYRIKLVHNNEMDQLIQSLDNCLERFRINIPEICDLYPVGLDGYLFKKYYRYLTHKDLHEKEAFTLVVDLFSNCLINGSYNRRKSIDYYNRLLTNKTLINDDSKSIVLHVIIGNNYFENSEYDNAFRHYDIAYSSIGGENLLTAEIFNRRGDVWTALNYYDKAILCYQRAFEFISSDSDKDEKLIAICNKIMKICPKENHKQYAEKYEKKSNEIIDHLEKNCKYVNKTVSFEIHQQFNDKCDPHNLHKAFKSYTEGKILAKGINLFAGLDKFAKAAQMLKECYSMFDRSNYLMCVNYEMHAAAYLVSKDILSALIAWKKSIDIRMSLRMESQ